MKIEIEIADTFFRDQVRSAACRYWCAGVEYGRPIGDLLPEIIIEHHEKRDSDSWSRLAANWPRAVQIAIDKYPRILDLDKMDGETGDMWLQLAAFGEIKYG